MRIPYKRKREGKTNYPKRLQMLVSRKHRLVIRKTLAGMIVQVVSYEPNGDKILVSAYARDLKKHGVPKINSNITIAYLTGFLCGVRAKQNKITSGIVDLGLQKAHPKGKLFAAVRGLRDAGIDVAADEKMFPDDSRIGDVEPVKKSILQ